MTAHTPITALPAFATLTQLASELKGVGIASLFEADPERVPAFSAEAAGLHLDFSKHLLNTAALEALVELAEQAGVKAGAEALLAGAEINNTEQRPALHTLLRGTGANELAGE